LRLFFLEARERLGEPVGKVDDEDYIHKIWITN